MPSVSRPSPSAIFHNPYGRWITDATLADLRAARTHAHRLYSSEAVWVERFGEDLLVSFQDQSARDPVLEELPQWLGAHSIAWTRIFGKFIPRQNQERVAPVLLAGPTGGSLETVVQENGVQFGLDFAAGYSAGLFIDQRANRSYLRRSKPKRLLNTFAYTCSFSVVAALAGAQTLSIDLSKKSLDRGRANFALNGLQTGPEHGHRFFADDVMESLPRLARKGELFDAIILDPPTFSRGHKGRRFQVEHDFEALLLATLEVAAPNARVLLSTNCTRIERRGLEAIGRFCLKATRRAGSFHSEPELADLPSSFGAQTVWIVLKN